MTIAVVIVIGADAVIATEEQDVEAEVKRMTAGAGADLIFDRALNPTISRTFSLDEIVGAHRFLESGEQVGKVVVTI